MIYLDLALRASGITVLLLLALLMWRAPVGWQGRLSVMAVAVAQSAFLLNDMALPVAWPPTVAANIALIASLTPVATTWLILTIFLDGPMLRWPWMVAATAASVALYLHLAFGGMIVFCALTAAILYGALFVLSLWSSRDDLVECRCRARPGFAASIAGVGLFLTGGQLIGFLEQESLAFAFAQSVGVLVVALAFSVWLLRPDMAMWPGEQTEAPRSQPAMPEREIDPTLVDQIEGAMAEGIWREEGLTIGALATRLNVPEHRLRRAINQGLGYRNFSSFINRARIDAARDMLTDPANMGKTVLEIAYDVGFASVGPFNRAFRAETGQSPTSYRREDHPRMIADSEKSSPIGAKLH